MTFIFIYFSSIIVCAWGEKGAAAVDSTDQVIV